jgi:hypothetical protein
MLVPEYTAELGSLFHKLAGFPARGLALGKGFILLIRRANRQ